MVKAVTPAMKSFYDSQTLLRVAIKSLEQTMHTALVQAGASEEVHQEILEHFDHLYLLIETRKNIFTITLNIEGLPPKAPSSSVTPTVSPVSHQERLIKSRFTGKIGRKEWEKTPLI
ncbi:hypothetical protein H1S01_04520 [Heliobacterium chlorum]|uniref:Uncharacterized protein n=1 Tax=Heliobacterium chlorum TaxID=2698 RepID=A0ABR7T296_HELCL|nr:hypothetical protein [Heliobacterium chlorum]MBC9783776.1 hypothetical protein [Heliobacterium chlorum]